MASGMADYSSIVRPKFGAAKRSGVVTVATAGDHRTLITITGKGILYGGYLISFGVAIQQNDTPYILLDGSATFGQAFTYLNAHGLNVERSALLFLRRFDNVKFVYSVGIGYGYTFEKSLVLRYSEWYGRVPDLHAFLHYALI